MVVAAAVTAAVGDKVIVCVPVVVFVIPPVTVVLVDAVTLGDLEAVMVGLEVNDDVPVVDKLMLSDGVAVTVPVRLAMLGVGAADSVPV